MQKTKFENIIFYLDLVGSDKKLIKRKDVSKSIINFIKNKREKNPNTTFGVFFFKEGGAPDSLFDQTELDAINKKIEKEWKERQTGESLLENGLMFCLSQIASEASEKSGDYRVVVLSDSPSKKNDEYQDAVFGLINTVRFFPTFIDIIRIGTERFYEDDVKLRILTRTTSGGLFYAQNSKELEEILVGLSKNKKLPDLGNKDGKIYIDEESRSFYENLAVEPLTPEPNETLSCKFCNKIDCEDCEEYSMILKCGCGFSFHLKHGAIYSFDNNIGLPNLFRCPQCDVLLKLDYETVLKINGINPESIEEEIMENEIEEKEDKEEELTEETPDATSSAENSPVEAEMESSAPKVVASNANHHISSGGFQFFRPQVPKEQGLPPVVESSTDSDIQQESKEVAQTQNEEWQPSKAPQKLKVADNGSETGALHPPGKATGRRRRNIRKFKICSICGTTNSGYASVCKNCKSPI